MAHEAGFLANAVRKAFNHSRVSFICQRDPADVGWWTDYITKYKMAYSMRFHFSMPGGLQFADEMICCNPWLPEDTRLKTAKDKFLDQIKRYKIVISGISATNPTSNPRVSVSGKTNKEGRVSTSFADDLAFCISANLYLNDLLLTRQLPYFNYEEVFQ